jgi:molybdate transport system substrate-binding protein
MLRVLLGVLAIMTATGVRTADLQVIAGGGIATPLTILSHQFEAATGHKLVIRFAATPELIKMATSDVPFDVAVAPREVFKDSEAHARFTAAPATPIARVGFGVAVRAGAPRPDIATPEALKQALLKAQSVAFVPQSAAGAQVLRAFETLGIADVMKAKTRSQPTPADIPLAVARGDAELGVFLLNVLRAPGVDLVGPFPAPLQQEFVFAAAIAAAAQDAATADAFIEFLKSPQAAETLKARGVTPG